MTEVLIAPQLNTLQQCMKNMLGSFTKHRHILHGGYTFAGTGAWVLQVKNFIQTVGTVTIAEMGQCPLSVMLYSSYALCNSSDPVH